MLSCFMLVGSRVLVSFLDPNFDRSELSILRFRLCSRSNESVRCRLMSPGQGTRASTRKGIAVCMCAGNGYRQTRVCLVVTLMLRWKANSGRAKWHTDSARPTFL